MHEKFTARIERGLQQMHAAAAAGRLKDEAVAHQRLGRLKEQNWRAAHAFDVTIKKLAAPRGKQCLEITWQRNARFADWSRLADGCYLLRSNLTGVGYRSPSARRSKKAGDLRAAGPIPLRSTSQRTKFSKSFDPMNILTLRQHQSQ